MTVIVVIICCCIPNFNKIGSRVRPPDAHNCWMYNVLLLGNDRCHGNRIMAHMSRTWWDVSCDHPSCVTVGPLVGELWHFECFPTWRPSAILNFKNFNIWSHDCHCGPNLLLGFIKIGSRVRPSDVHNYRMFNESLLGNGRCHGNRIVGDMSGTWCDVTTQVGSQSVHW